MEREHPYDVVIVGGGITGTALFYALSRYTNVGRIALLEKEREIALLNSHVDNNSHTLHFGDIETNYSLEKAVKVKEAADMVKAYIEKRSAYRERLFRKTHKMVLAVGGFEVRELEDRYQRFKDLFPGLRLIGRDEIMAIEPKVVEGRDPNKKISALLSDDGYAVDFQELSWSFYMQAKENGQDKAIDYFPRTLLQNIRKSGNVFELSTNIGTFYAKTVVLAAGPHSLIFAKQLGYGLDYGLLPVAGSFYSAGNVLRGKVYTMQIWGIPFAAIHGDPAVNCPDETRFGPTAKVLPVLERGRYRTIPDFLRTSAITFNGALSLLNIISNKVIFKYFLKNVLYDFPVIGRWAFLREVRKIVPSLRYCDLQMSKGFGGIRPQLVDTRKKKMEMGEAKIIGAGIIFNITPSPGASVCLKNAEIDVRTLMKFLGDGYTFDDERFKKDHTPAAA